MLLADTPHIDTSADKFTAIPTASQGVCTAVELKDIEGSQNARDEMYYELIIGGETMDPEIINKSGGSSGNSSWVRNTSE